MAYLHLYSHIHTRARTQARTHTQQKQPPRVYVEDSNVTTECRNVMYYFLLRETHVRNQLSRHKYISNMIVIGGEQSRDCLGWDRIFMIFSFSDG